MKKIFTLFAAAMMTVSTFAQADEPLFTVEGQLVDYNDEETTCVTFEGSMQVEMYDGYTIVRSWAGVEGYDICLVHAEGDLTEGIGVSSAFNIINGEEQEPYEADGYTYLYTGREDYPLAAITLNYGGYDYTLVYSEDGVGSVYMYYPYWFDAEDNYICADYYLEWGKGEDEDGIQNVTVTKSESPIFNLFGQPVTPDYKGIVIQNGKKLMK